MVISSPSKRGRRIIASLVDRRRKQSHTPRQRLVEATPELEVVRGIDGAVAVEIEKELVPEAGRFIEGGTEGKVVAAVDGTEFSGFQFAPHDFAKLNGVTHEFAASCDKAVSMAPGQSKDCN